MSWKLPDFNATLARFDRKPLRYGVSNRLLAPRLPVDRYLEALFSTSATLIQWREPDLDEGTSRALVRRGAELATRSGRLFFVNSDVRLAFEEGAQGVHLKSNQKLALAIRLRERARSGLWVGQSVHSLAEALHSQAAGADYLILGPIFPPLSKKSQTPPLGLHNLRRAVAKLGIPVFAIGGIEEDNAAAVFATGVAGIAGITWMQRELDQLGRGSRQPLDR